MKWKTVSTIFLVVVVYLIIGATVFKALEQPHETSQRDTIVIQKQMFLSEHSCVNASKLDEVIQHEMLKRKMDDLLSHQRQFVENNHRSLEQKIKEKEKEVLHQLHDLLTGDLQCDQINQDLQQANSALRAELDKTIAVKQHLENDFIELNTEAVQSRTGFTSKPVKGTGIINNLNRKSEMKEKNLLRCQSAQKSEKIHLLEEELKTARRFLKETQNYAEEMKNKSLSQETQLEKKEAEIRDLEGKSQNLVQQLQKVQSDLQFKEAEIAHLQNLSSAELARLKEKLLTIEAEQKELQEQHNLLLQENEQLSKLDNLSSIVQLKKQNGFAHSKLKTWMKSCKQLGKEKEMLQKEIADHSALLREHKPSADEVAIYLHSLTQDNEPEYEPDGLPEVVRKGFADIPTGKNNPCVLRRTALNLRTSPHLAPGGSKSQKIDDTQQCQAETAIEPMESRSRSPFCMNKQHTKAVAENSRENLNTHEGRCSLSTQKLPDQNKQDKNCMVQ